LVQQASLERVSRLRAAGQGTEAEVVCRKILAKDPDNPDALWLLGALCYQSGRGDEAQVMLGRAIGVAEALGRTPPLDWSLSLGSVQQQCGERHRALETFTAAAKDHPGSGEAHFCLATALQSLDRAEEAIAKYRIALDLDPDNAPPSAAPCAYSHDLAMPW
jgi:Flp pilus assembly protein TadD